MTTQSLGVILGHGTLVVPEVRFTRAQFYALSEYLDPEGRFELLGGIIYALSPVPGPPHASTVAFLDYHLSHGIDRAKYLIKSENALEINGIDDTPQPDIAVVTMRADFYATSQPTGADAHLVIEVGDTERNPRAKMRNYMRDGRIPLAWRIDIPHRCVEIWTPADVENPRDVLRGDDRFDFAGVGFVVNEIPAFRS